MPTELVNLFNCLILALHTKQNKVLDISLDSQPKNNNCYQKYFDFCNKSDLQKECPRYFMSKELVKIMRPTEVLIFCFIHNMAGPKSALIHMMNLSAIQKH